MRELALFAGAGSGLLGSKLLGWKTVCAVEIAAFPREVLFARQRDGRLDRFPIWDDVATFDGRSWRGSVDVISGGFPCQDISSSGTRKGLSGGRSGLWREYARIISEVQPQFALIENSSLLVNNGLRTVLGDLAQMGYNARWGCFKGLSVGAPHKRERCWIVANSNSFDVQGDVVNVPGLKKTPWPADPQKCNELPIRLGTKTRTSSGGVADGLAYRVDRFKAVGNGQIPAMVVAAWKSLTNIG